MAAEVRPMASRLLRELDITIQTTRDRNVWARSVCRQASTFARQGEIAVAVQAIAAVRAKFGNALEPEVAAWLMLTEGILNFYSGDADLGIGRLKSAHAIASAIDNCAARPTCAAWMALYSLNTRRFDDMARLLKESLQLASEDDHQARARASLVLADGFHFGGRFDLARPWYDLTRLHATKEGDESAISAMLHNVAAFRAANLKLADALGTRLHDEARRASMEAMSAAAYDHAIGTKSFGQFIPHVTAQLLIVEKKYEEALSSLSRIEVDGLPKRVHAVHHADIATCALHLGDRSLVDQMIRSTEQALETQMDSDDIVYACCRLASIYEALGKKELAAEAQSRASREIEAFRIVQAELVVRLVQVTEAVAST
jgi:tetratricopeptide (TPR) repeat protein